MILVRYLDIPYLVISHDTGHDVTIYRDIPCDITHTRSPRNTRHTNPNSTKTHHLVAVYSCFFRLCLCPHLRCVRVAFFCRSSAVHQLDTSWDWPYHQQTATSSSPDSPAPWAHACLFWCHFSFFLFFPCLFSFLIPGINTWYLTYYCC